MSIGIESTEIETQGQDVAKSITGHIEIVQEIAPGKDQEKGQEKDQETDEL